MAEINISSSSWLNFTQLLDFNGTLFWDETNLPDIPISDDDEYVQLTRVQSKRVDLLAYEKYQDAELWWVILQANGIDLPSQLYEGLVIRVPSRETVEKLFQERQELI